MGGGHVNSTVYAVHLMAGIMRSGRSHPLRCIKDILMGKYLQGPRIVREPYYWFGYQSILLLYAILVPGDPSRHSVQDISSAFKSFHYDHVTLCCCSQGCKCSCDAGMFYQSPLLNVHVASISELFVSEVCGIQPLGKGDITQGANRQAQTPIHQPQIRGLAGVHPYTHLARRVDETILSCDN
jgi:hypothetical protein